jgi:2-polyprenyl-6-methoxyphenol hydroxylase-like FAD-dependent oxidoreductase
MSERTAIVIGGGIGGLTAAAGLSRTGWRVMVFEQAARFAAVGAGIALALLGDAAHAMTPDLGQGACQALEDAVVLTACAAADVPAALADYDRARRARTQELVRASARVAQLANTGNPGAAWLRDLVARLLRAAAYLRASADTFGWQPPARPQLVRQGG